ncbi:MAG: type II secretion system protein, partial [Planctomycetaceae bacterium]
MQSSGKASRGHRLLGLGSQVPVLPRVASHPVAPRAGFTLIELLVVIAI